MSALFGHDAFAPREIARRVSDLGVAKARLPLPTMAMLGVLAGAFIGLGALLSMVVLADASIPFGIRRVLAGAVFALGLFLVLVAGAELFTGNNLLAMAWAERKVTTGEMLFNWTVVLATNFAGAAGLAALVFLSGHGDLGDGAIARAYLDAAARKTSLPFGEAFFSGMLANVLVCTAVWVALAGHSVTDKFLAILLPVTAFVAAGFQHSVANMYQLPFAMMLQAEAGQAVELAGLWRNLVPVILGNIVGGSVLVALVYWVIYLRSPAAPAPASEEDEEHPLPTGRGPG